MSSHCFKELTSHRGAVLSHFRNFSDQLSRFVLIAVLGVQLAACGGGTDANTGTVSANSELAPTSADTQAPTVSLTSPNNGSTVSGTVSLAANATDNVGVAGVRFKLDGANLGAEDATSPYSVSWNTTSVSNGVHTLTATARDAAGNTATAASVTVTVSNADTQAPTAPTQLTATAASSSQINLSWKASTDNVNVTGYRVYRNGSQVATVTSTSYPNTGLSPATTYTYAVSAYDAAGNVSAQSSSASATTQAVLPTPITGAPYILYTDILSGPNSGGENDKGAYLSIFGKNFGGTGLGSTVKVYINNVEVDNYRYLGPSKGRSDIEQITVQVGALGNPPAGTPLPIKVVVNGVASNTDKTFIVNPGRILFVDNVNGNDSTAVVGDITHPFRHVQTSSVSAAAYGQLKPGDTIVMRGRGTNYTDTGYGNYFLKFISKAGSAPTGASGSGPITLMSYPGEEVYIVAPTSLSGAISGANQDPWFTIADLHVEGDGTAGVVNLQIGSDHWRIVNNELTAPGAGSIAAKAGGITGSGAATAFLGNNIHNITGSTGENHGIYIDGDGDYDIGYNDIHDVHSGYGVQAYNDGSNGSTRTNNFSVHHNLIHNINGKSCINIADGSAAGFKVWNNICYNANNSGLRFNTQTLTGCVVYNNTFYNSDSTGRYSPIQNDWSTLSASQVVIQNNIVWSGAGSAYIGGQGFGSGVLSNNLWYGAGSAPKGDSSPIASNPLFVNPGTDFHLQPGSPAIDAGASSVSGLVTDDYDVVARPQGAAYDVGAMEE